MAAPAGSVCAAGIRHDVDVEVAGKDPTLASIGWVEVSRTDAERRAGIEALMALIGVGSRPPGARCRCPEPSASPIIVPHGQLGTAPPWTPPGPDDF